ncbi:MAG: EamA family transporter RarD [Propionibacterium sp.]|nr:EamA family transporter RarD [Propionibacterium sp.]
MKDLKVGWGAGLAAYLLWGAFPLYFVLLARSAPLEVVAHRVIWSLAFCLLILAVTRGFDGFAAIWRDRRAALLMTAAGVLITLNWSTYIIGVLSGRTLEAALGYFINPLAVVAFGVLVFKEKLRPLQKLALVFGVAAVIVMVLAYGEIPWIALILTFTFGTYSLVKKVVGATVKPVPGLAFETTVVVPLALAFVIYLGAVGESTFTFDGYGALLVASGVITAIPLLMFAVAAKHLPMVALGVVQYLAPIGQFLIGWLILDEPMPASRWAGFALVWVAIALFVGDALRQGRRR